MYFLLEAIVLSRKRYREHDRVVSVYSRERGRGEFLASGGQKINAKAYGSLSPFSFLSLWAVHGVRHDRIIGVEAIKNASAFEQNLSAVGLASYCTQLVERLTPLGQPEVRVFSLLCSVFFEHSPSVFCGKELRYATWFAVQLLHILGWGVTERNEALSREAYGFLVQLLQTSVHDVSSLVCSEKAGTEVARFVDRQVREQNAALHREERLPARDFFFYMMQEK